MARSLENRLAKIEQELAEVEREEKLATCICQNNFVIVSSGSVQEFKAEMNRVCPVHGFRELDILHLVFEKADRDFSSSAEIEDTEVQELLDEYYRRLAEAKGLLFED